MKKIKNFKNFKISESVRHGSFPYFVIDRETFSVDKGNASNDLAVDAINYPYDGQEETHFGYCIENWSESMRDSASEVAVSMLKNGKSDGEIREFLDEKYERY